MATAPESLLERIRARVIVTASACWEWQGSTNGNGYGEIRIKQRKHYVHRLTVELTRGPIADGMDIDHLCRNRSCCNPDHLEVVTRHVNIMRGDNPDFQRRRFAAITHCPQSHPYDAANTYVTKAGTRQCKACTRARNKARRQRQRANHE